jgi:predicted acetyltransferase
MSIKLIHLTNEHQQQLGEMIEEWVFDQKVNHTNHSPWAIFKNDYHDFSKYLEQLDQKKEENGLVPNTVLFLYDDERKRLLGAVDIRHRLNQSLLLNGGHIGDGIRPSERQKGYGTILVKLALEECKKLGISKVLMVCDKTNIASRNTIVHNGGILENEVTNSDGSIDQRFWIELEK